MSTKILIPAVHPHHQRLSDMMQTVLSKYDVRSVFLSYSTDCKKHLLLIYISSSQISDEASGSNWIKKAFHQLDTQIIILGSSDITRHLRLGSLFINRFCTEHSLIYLKAGHEVSYPVLEKQLKKFKVYKNEYYHNHDLISTEVRKAENSNSLTLAYQLYHTLYEHHIYHLEFSCLGRTYYDESLDKRLLRLENFLPQIKSLFLKKTESTYYLIDAI